MKTPANIGLHMGESEGYMLFDTGDGSMLRPGFRLQHGDRITVFKGCNAAQGIDVFGGSAAFARDGFGVCAMAGDTVAAAATTYSLSSDKAEVAISTHAAHRGKGLATAVSAAMLAVCLLRGVEPHWNASNPVSQRLALRLGFVQVGVCEIVVLDG